MPYAAVLDANVLHPIVTTDIYAPAAMVGYFDELAAAIAHGEMDDDTLGEIARRYGMEVIGPVPEGYV